MKLGEIVVHMGNYNFTKFHQIQIRNKKVLLIACFSVQNFKVSVELWKLYIVPLELFKNPSLTTFYRIRLDKKQFKVFNPPNNTFHDEILSLKTRQEFHLISLWQTKWHGQMFRKIMKGQLMTKWKSGLRCKFQLARQIFQFYI